MLKPLVTMVLLFAMNTTTSAQGDLPYHEIPEYPEVYTAENVAARMIECKECKSVRV